MFAGGEVATMLMVSLVTLADKLMPGFERSSHETQASR